MTLKEQLYFFDGLDIHSAIILQSTIEARKTNITHEQSEVMRKGDKAIKAVIEEIDQIYDDLDRHIAAQVRIQEHLQKAKPEPKDALFKQSIGK